MMLRKIIPGIALAALLLSPLAAQSQSGASVPVYTEFEQIEPLFHLDNDTTYVINFWATWCKPCVEELPYIEQLHEVYGAKKLKVILVSLDFVKQIETKLLPFVEKHQLQSEVLVLTDGKYDEWIDKVSPEWDGAIPVTLVYKGQERTFINTDFHSFEELDKIVGPYLEAE